MVFFFWGKTMENWWWFCLLGKRGGGAGWGWGVRERLHAREAALETSAGSAEHTGRTWNLGWLEVV